MQSRLMQAASRVEFSLISARLFWFYLSGEAMPASFAKIAPWLFFRR
jgi:hypothetical protein